MTEKLEIENAIEVLIKNCKKNDSFGFNHSLKRLVNGKKTIYEIDFNINQYEFDDEEKEFINILEKENE